MRPGVLVAVAATLVVALLVADSVIGERIESETERRLRADLEQRTGADPGSVDVSLEGFLAGLRAVTAPAPDATALVRDIAIPGTEGSLTRLRVSVRDVEVDLGDALGAAERIALSAASGTFSAVIAEEDLNTTIPGRGLFERLEVRDGVIVAIPVGEDPALRTEGRGVAFTAELGRLEDADALVLRAADAPEGLQAGAFAGAMLSIPLALPEAFTLERLRTREGRLVGSGSVDVDSLVASAQPAPS